MGEGGKGAVAGTKGWVCWCCVVCVGETERTRRGTSTLVGEVVVVVGGWWMCGWVCGEWGCCDGG